MMSTLHHNMARAQGVCRCHVIIGFVSSSEQTWPSSGQLITASADQKRHDGKHENESGMHRHMCCGQQALQVMAYGSSASAASQVRTCMACWGKGR